MIICIAGRSGCGKSTVAGMISKALNMPVLHVDKIAPTVRRQPEIEAQVVEYFGREILGEDEHINPQKLGFLVFKKGRKGKENWNALLKITWPAMEKIITEELKASGGNLIMEYVLMPLTQYWDKADYRILMKAAPKISLSRVKKRDNLDVKYLKIRNNAAPIKAVKPPKVDFIIKNNGDINDLTKKVAECINKVREKKNGK